MTRRDLMCLLAAAALPLQPKRTQPIIRTILRDVNPSEDQPAAAPLAIAKRGAYVGFDHSGKPDDPRADEYVKTILSLLDAGLANRICLVRLCEPEIPAQERRARHRHDDHELRAAAPSRGCQ